MSFPLARSVLVREQTGSALNRLARRKEAEEVLLKLIEERGPSSETNGILGRVYKDSWEDNRRPGNATAAIGFQKDPSRHTTYHALILGEPFERVVQKSQVQGLDVVPADKNLAGAAVELVSAEQREYKLQAYLQSVREKYRFIILDCPPALDLLTLNALVSADAVLVPIQCEYLALEGVSELLDTLMRIRRTLNPKLEIEGILLTMYDERTTLARQVATDLRSFFGTQVFQSVIARNVRLAEAPSFGKPIIFYDIHSKGAEGYTQLAQEVIANAEKRVGAGARSAHSGA